LKIGREAAENLISDHDLEILYQNDPVRKAELKNRINLNLRVLDEVHGKIFASVENLNEVSLSNIEFIKIQSEKQRQVFVIGYVLIVLFFLLLLLAVSYLISSPIIGLVRKLKSGNSGEKIAEKSFINEIELLKKAYNTLMDELENSTISSANLEAIVKEKTLELEKKNSELEKTLDDFYVMRLSMQKQMNDGTIDGENKKIKKKLDTLKRSGGGGGVNNPNPFL